MPEVKEVPRDSPRLLRVLVLDLAPRFRPLCDPRGVLPSALAGAGVLEDDSSTIVSVSRDYGLGCLRLKFVRLVRLNGQSDERRSCVVSQ